MPPEAAQIRRSKSKSKVCFVVYYDINYKGIVTHGKHNLPADELMAITILRPMTERSLGGGRLRCAPVCTKVH